jgi:hypothetical protein
VFYAVDLDNRRVVLVEPTDLRSLSVRVTAPPDAQGATHGELLDGLIEAGGLGRPDGHGDLLLERHALIEGAGATATPQWHQEFEAMCAYAESKGWVHEGRLQAHVQWPAIP